MFFALILQAIKLSLDATFQRTMTYIYVWLNRLWVKTAKLIVKLNDWFNYKWQIHVDEWSKAEIAKSLFVSEVRALSRPK